MQMYNNNALATMKNIVDPNLKMTDKKTAIFLSVTPAMPMCSQTRHQGETVRWGNCTVISNPTRSASPSASNILRSLLSPQKSAITTGLRAQTSALLQAGQDGA